MVTLKLKNKAAGAATERAPLRGKAGSARPTLAQAQAQRAEREARYQEQLRQRYGDRPPAAAARPRQPQQPQQPQPPERIDPRTLAPNDLRHRLQRSEPAPPAPRERAPSRQPGPRSEVRPTARHAPPHRARANRDDDEREDHESAPHEPGSMRLSKRMSELGIASRREADEWIAKGWVRVDDHIVSELGSRVMPGQRVTVDAKAKFQQAQRVTVLINKPVGYVSGQAEDGYEPAFVLVQPQNQWREDHSGTRFLREHLRSLVPAGRLDIDSVGLLVLTQDGRVAKQLVGEDGEVEKEYLVRVEPLSGTTLTDEGLALLHHGLELDGEALKPAQVEWLNADQLRFVLREGKKRQIRRMCEAVGLKVIGLKRVRIGGVMLGDLPTGQWRYLRADESFV
jgi:23S rRNA pseudouridine2604 synthase